MRLWQLAGSRRLLVTGMCVIVWRAFAQIPVPGLSPALIAQLQPRTNSGFEEFGFGIPLGQFSLIAMGLGSYVWAVIGITSARVFSKKIRSLETTSDGRRSLARWTRGLAVLLALGQANGFTYLMQQTSPPGFPVMDWSARLLVMLVMVGGFVSVLFLADILDEFGLGFGNGAFLIYALTPLADQVHRLAGILATSPSVQALYLPLAIWAAFALAVVVVTIATLLAGRRIPPAGAENRSEWAPVEVRLLMAGVLRPPVIAFTLLSSPVILVTSFYAGNSGLPRWLTDVYTPYGPNPWTDAGYVTVNAALVVALVYLLVALDTAYRPIRPDLIFTINRLLFIGGSMLAITTVVAPILEWNATRAAGRGIPMSGLEAAFLTAVILAIVIGLDRSGRMHTGMPVLTGPVP